MKKVIPLFLVAILLAALVLAACGGGMPAPQTKEIVIGQGDEITFEAIGGQEGPIQVKIVFTTVEDGQIYFQSFSDGELMPGGQKVYQNLDLFPGLTLQPGNPPQLIIEYQVGRWRPLPQ